MLKGPHRWLSTQNIFSYSKEKTWGYSRISSNVGLDQKALKGTLKPAITWGGKVKSPLLTLGQPCSSQGMDQKWLLYMAPGYKENFPCGTVINLPKRRQELTVSPRETYDWDCSRSSETMAGSRRTPVGHQNGPTHSSTVSTHQNQTIICLPPHNS